MKQYLTLEQSAYLVEIGYALPKSVSKLYYDDEGRVEDIEHSYSIGELISLLPIISIDYKDNNFAVFVKFPNTLKFIINETLIDALYNACVILKTKQ